MAEVSGSYRPVARKRLGQTLVDMGLLAPDQLAEVLAEQQRTGKRIGQLVVEKGWASAAQLADALSQHLGIPRVRWEEVELSPGLVRLLPERFSRHAVLPIRLEGETLYVATPDPLDVVLLDDIRAATGYRVVPLIATAEEIEAARNRFSSLALTTEQVVEQVEQEPEPVSEEELIDPNSPAVRMVNLILSEAVQRRSSDIHLEPQRDRLRVRFRIDGLLRDITSVPRSLQSSVISRVKVMAGLDVAEHRRPQDGQMHLKVGDSDIEMRVSVLPAIYGEKVVIRVLHRSARLITIDRLGLLPRAQQWVEEMLRQRQGLILVTGPTGSGKSTSLYAFLQALNQPERNIITVEDPVEYRIDGITQVQVNPKAGLTFASALRSVLRQDPDIIMVGEIRDTETAEIAIRAALTGHLVLSTLHTNSAPGTVVRLTDMGIEPYLLSGTLIGVVAQRLVRSLCRECADWEHRELTPFERRFVGESWGNRPLPVGRGCHHCEGTGYRGRILVEEVLLVDRRIRECLSRGPSEDEVRRLAVQAGMRTLKETGIAKVQAGRTTLEEVCQALHGLEELEHEVSSSVAEPAAPEAEVVSSSMAAGEGRR